MGIGFALILKGIVKNLPAIMIAGLVAALFFLKGQKDKANQQIDNIKAKAQSEKKAREVEQQMYQNEEQAHNAADQERARQDHYKDNGKRPDTFGDDRLR